MVAENPSGAQHKSNPHIHFNVVIRAVQALQLNLTRYDTLVFNQTLSVRIIVLTYSNIFNNLTLKLTASKSFCGTLTCKTVNDVSVSVPLHFRSPVIALGHIDERKEIKMRMLAWSEAE